MVGRRDERPCPMRLWHRQGAVPSFTKRYGITPLMHFDMHDKPSVADQRERNIKHRSRALSSISSMPRIRCGAASTPTSSA